MMKQLMSPQLQYITSSHVSLGARCLSSQLDLPDQTPLILEFLLLWASLLPLGTIAGPLPPAIDTSEASMASPVMAESKVLLDKGKKDITLNSQRPSFKAIVRYDI